MSAPPGAGGGPLPPMDYTDHSSRQFRLDVALAVVTTVLVMARAYCRALLVRNWRLDDTFAMLAWAVLMVIIGLEIGMCLHGGGRHIETVSFPDLKIFATLFPTAGLLYFTAVGLVRLSVVAFLPRLTPDKNIKKIAWGLGIFVSIMAIVASLVMALQCQPVSALWIVEEHATARCYSTGNLFIAVPAIGVAVDLILLCIPLRLIYTTMRWNITTLRVMLIFAVGFLACTTGIVRLAVVANFPVVVHQDITWIFGIISPWTMLEAHAGLWAASFPALQPILRYMGEKTRLTAAMSRIVTATTPSEGQYSNDNTTSGKHSRRSRRDSEFVDLSAWEKGKGFSFSVSAKPEGRLGLLPDCDDETVGEELRPPTESSAATRVAV